MADIAARVRTVRELFGERFALGAYQRDYEWEQAEVLALFEDLRLAFQSRVGRKGAAEYFLGPIVTKKAEDGRHPFLVDGQQRLTTLALFVCAIRYASRSPERFGAMSADREADAALRVQPTLSLSDPPLKSPLLGARDLPPIFASQDRQSQLEELERVAHLRITETDSARLLEEAFKTLLDRIVESFDPSDLRPLLAWIADFVVLAEIRAGATHNDFTIFDTMNSRGRPLAPLSQFLAYLGRKIPDRPLREQAQARFKEVQAALTTLGKRQDVEFVKSWLSARSLRLEDPTPADGRVAASKLAGSLARDINAKTIRFAMDNAETMPELGLANASQFVEQHWAVYGGHYVKIRNAYERHDPEFDSLWFLAQTKFESVLDYFDEVALLAACPPGSSATTARLKLVAQFLENIAARVAWLRICEEGAHRANHRERLKYLVARAAGAIRGQRPQDVAETLAMIQEDELGFGFEHGKRPRLNASNKFLVRALLGRLTWYLDELNGTPTPFASYLVTTGANKCDIEHLLPAPFARGPALGHSYTSRDNYAKDRQRLGALVILRSAFNKEMSDRPYALKLQHYANNQPNALQMTLRGQATLSSALRNGLLPTGASFPDAMVLRRPTLDQREKALRAVASYLWGPTRLRELGRALEP